MGPRVRALTAAILAVGMAETAPVVRAHRTTAPQIVHSSTYNSALVAARRAELQRMLEAYAAGDHSVVAAAFDKRPDSATLGALTALVLDKEVSWTRARAAFALEFLVGFRGFNGSILTIGRNPGIVTRRPQRIGANATEDRFEVLYHQILIAVLERNGVWSAVHDYLDAIGSRIEQFARLKPALPDRLVLAQAMETAMRCCRDRLGPFGAASYTKIVTLPGLTPPAAPREAIAKYDEAAANPSMREEALVRGAVVALRTGRPQDALARLDRASPISDHVLAYAAGLARAGAFDQIGRPERAADAYRAVLRLEPLAQGPAIGLAAALLRAGLEDEAVTEARRARGLEVVMSATDVLPRFADSDARFIELWMRELRELLR